MLPDEMTMKSWSGTDEKKSNFFGAFTSADFFSTPTPFTATFKVQDFGVIDISLPKGLDSDPDKDDIVVVAK